MNGEPAPGRRPAAMRFTVEGWQTGYGAGQDGGALEESAADVVLDLEVPPSRWLPVNPPDRADLPDAVLFVDGVRRIDARVWIEEPPGSGGRLPAPPASAGICASYAAGVVCCCDGRAHVIAVEVRRGLFTTTRQAAGVQTNVGTYEAYVSRVPRGTPVTVGLSSALQQRLAEVEAATAGAARSALADHVRTGGDLLVVDGPLRGRAHLPRALGFIKSHHSEYLPPELNSIVATLRAGQRTPVFRMGTTWDRHSWYLRLPCRPGAPWAGIVRLEASADLPRGEVVEVANLSQRVLPRYASTEYKDPRAPQNLYPIAGLEKHLRHRLGDHIVVHRGLRSAAAGAADAAARGVATGPAAAGPARR